MKKRDIVKSYGHRINALSNGKYKLHWIFNARVWNSKKFYARVMSRVTNIEGAYRFAKKWNIHIPK